MKNQDSQKKLDKKEVTIWNHIWKWTRRILLGGVLFFIFLFGILQIPAVQKWTVQQLIHSISKATDADVYIDYVYLSYFDKLALEDFYLVKEQQDTVLGAKTLKIDFDLNPLVLFSKGLVVEGMDLENAKLNLISEAGELKNNFSLVLNQLFPKKEKKKASKPFQLEIGVVNLTNVTFYQENETRANLLEIFIKSGQVRLKQLDFANNLIEIDQAIIDGANVRVENNPIPDSLLLAKLDSMWYVQSTANDSVKNLLVKVHDFDFNNGSFLLNNNRKAPKRIPDSSIIDYKHMDVFNISLDVDSFSFVDREFDFSAIVNKIAAEEASGFVLNRLSGRKVKVASDGAFINDLQLITPYSNIGDTLVFKYRSYTDFLDFENRVRMDGRMNAATVAIRDILFFAPGLNSNAFFKNNREEAITIDGIVRGSVNNLRGRELNMELAGDTQIVGNFSFNNLTVKNEEVLSLNLNYLGTSMRTLRQLIPRFKPPENFNKLGRLRFNGTFDGLLTDFVADGNLSTALGNATVEDMRMDLKNGRDKAEYEGILKLIDFDLGKWTDNEDFGIVNFTTNIKNGIGLTRQNIDANLDANIETFSYRGYNYKNAIIEGFINYNLFSGSMVIKDENVDLAFNGNINFNEGKPNVDVVATVKKLDLKKLNLAKDDIVLSGNLGVNLENTSITSLEGSAQADSIIIRLSENEIYQVEKVDIVSESDLLGNRSFKIDSDILQCAIYGIFELEQIPNAFIEYALKNFPGFSRKLKLKPPKKEILPTNFSYNVTLYDTKGLERLLSSQLEQIQDLVLSGRVNNLVDSIEMYLEIPYLKFGQLEFEDVAWEFEGEGNEAEFALAIDSTIIGGKRGLTTLALLSLAYGDTLYFGINYSPSRYASFIPGANIVEKFNLDGVLSVIDSTVLQFQFDPSELVILENSWNILPDNYLRLDSNWIEVENLRLSRENMVILLEEVKDNGLSLSIENLAFSYLDTLWKEEKVDFGGKYSLALKVQDFFKMEGLTLQLSSDTLWVNDDDWGKLNLFANAANLKSKLITYLGITKEDRQLIAEGTFNLAAQAEEVTRPEDEASYFDFDLDITNYPLNIAEYFIGPEVNNVEGSIAADLRFWGPPSKPNVGGTINLADGAFTVDYLKTRYTFNKSDVKVDNSFFNASSTYIFDRNLDTAILYGGISHDHLKNFGIDARVKTSRFLALDTKKGDNKMFYGRAFGDGDIWFSGSFQQTDIYVNAEVGEGTILNIPVDSEKDASKLNFVRFVDKDDRNEIEVNKPVQRDLRGLSFEMDLIVKKESQVRIIFDEQAGDIIQGAGRGNLRMLLPRGQDFQMYGNYVIEEGDYLFTLYNVVNKNFSIKKGGTVQWNGNPFGAEIDIQAEYKNLNTSVSNFIQEYLLGADSDLKNEATNPTNIDLTLNLQGELLQPIISFDIDFPNLRGQLQNYTESKLRVLKQDQNELNKQVFGLILAGQFLPSDFNLQGSQILYNTVSEFVSNQLSLLLTELFSEFIGEDELLNSIDFDIAYNQYQSVDLGEGQDFNRGDELQVRLKQTFFNDRLSVLVGGEFGIGSTLSSTTGNGSAITGNDFIVELTLNEDRSLKLVVYQRLEADIGSGRRFQIGSGLSYRKEFESFSDFLKSFRGGKKNKKPDG